MSENPVRSAVRGDDLKTAVAASAARWIAEEGCDYATAKRRAVREVLGEAAGALGAMPDNALVESELRRYLRLFAADSQPAQLATLRRLALRWMRRLHEFNPHLVGAVLNGTATGHSGIHLNLYTDSAKDVEIFLLNQSQSFDVRDAGRSRVPGTGPAGQRARRRCGRDAQRDGPGRAARGSGRTGERPGPAPSRAGRARQRVDGRAPAGRDRPARWRQHRLT